MQSWSIQMQLRQPPMALHSAAALHAAKAWLSAAAITPPCDAPCPCCRVGQELMAAAGVSGIPHSLVVNRAGVIKFSGHPADPAFMSAVREVQCIATFCKFCVL